MITYNDFISKHIGKAVDYDGKKYKVRGGKRVMYTSHHYY